MPDAIVLHVVDFTTPADSFAAIAALVDRGAARQTQHVVAALGHHSSRAMAQDAGMDGEKMHFIRSAGWADPSGWRGLRRLIQEQKATHLHGWGAPAGAVIAFCGQAAARASVLLTLTNAPAPRHRRLLRWIDRKIGSRIQWVASSATVTDALATAGIDSGRIAQVRLGVTTEAEPGENATLREELDLHGHEPIILLAGDGLAADRHDFGLWTVMILQKLLPEIRLIVRENARGAADPGLERLIDELPDGRVTVVAGVEHSWRTLCGVADLMLVSAVTATPQGCMLQAMSAGTPVLGTPIESVREVIQDGRNGLVSGELNPRSLAARAEAFFDDPALRKPIIAAARADVAAGFSVRALLDSYQNLYKVKNA